MSDVTLVSPAEATPQGVQPATPHDVNSLISMREIWKQEATSKWFLLRDGREVDAQPIADLDQVIEAAARRVQRRVHRNHWPIRLR